MGGVHGPSVGRGARGGVSLWGEWDARGVGSACEERGIRVCLRGGLCEERGAQGWFGASVGRGGCGGAGGALSASADPRAARAGVPPAPRYSVR